MSVPFVDLNPIHIPIMDEVNYAIKRVIDSKDFIRSNVVEKFEENFANYIGVKYAIGCANGTDALELALEVLGLSQNDEVIVPVHSWVSTASAVHRLGAKVVFADTLIEEYTINPASICQKITSKTKAIIVVHLYGHPCQMDEIMAIAQKHNIIIIEDCAQAHGAMYKGKKVGSFGLLSCFSFYPSKNLGAFGDAGAVLTNEKVFAERVKFIANCGQISKNEIAYIGRNSRLDAIQAAILDVKLKYLDEWNVSRRRLAHMYTKKLAKSTLITPVEKTGFYHVYHLYVVKSSRRAEVVREFEANHISCMIHYPYILSDLKPFSSTEDFPNARTYQNQIISLPMYAYMEEHKIEFVQKFLSTL